MAEAEKAGMRLENNGYAGLYTIPIPTVSGYA